MCIQNFYTRRGISRRDFFFSKFKLISNQPIIIMYVCMYPAAQCEFNFFLFFFILLIFLLFIKSLVLFVLKNLFKNGNEIRKTDEIAVLVVSRNPSLVMLYGTEGLGEFYGLGKVYHPDGSITFVMYKE